MIVMAKKRGPRPNPESKRSQGVDRHANPRKSFHAEPPLFTALEKYVAEASPQPSESAVLRTALIEFLQNRGYWPQAPE